MDKNTIIGVALIALVLIGFTFLNRPTPEEGTIPQSSTQMDSLVAEANSPEEETVSTTTLTGDSLQTIVPLLGEAAGKEQIIKLENEKVAVTFSSRGGYAIQARLKEYKAQEGQPLDLFTPEDSYFNLPLRTAMGRVVDTKDLYFEPIRQADSTLTMRLRVDSIAYLDLVYTLLPNDYRMRLTIRGAHLDRLFPSNMRYQDLELGQKIRRQELSWQNENQYSAIYYKLFADNVERLSEKGSKTEKINERISWIAFKDKFFSAVWIADAGNAFENSNLEQIVMPKDGDYTKECKVNTTFPFTRDVDAQARFTLYMGPLEHHLLKAYDKGIEADQDRLHLEHLVYVGGSVFRWINVHLIIPIVDFLSKYISNWGVIILLLTLIIKTALSPLTFKSYLSQAKMRVLKPQIKAINDKYPGQEQAMMMKRSQETMALYKQAGASPMSGCLPMLLQMPFLISLYMFFPTAIALRGESFLWASDLSTYDAILSWDFDIPILSGLMGNHLSLFCLLWAVTNILYSQYTMNMSGAGDNQQMKMMKYMPYIMSVMFFFFFNNNASGLCYYYFISTLITILQFLASRLLINEEKVLAKIEENKKKPKKKSGFMARLEEAQRLQQQQMRNQQKKGR